MLAAGAVAGQDASARPHTQRAVQSRLTLADLEVSEGMISLTAPANVTQVRGSCPRRNQEPMLRA